ncbi:MAG TPA: helix-turn-helix transcriptional regulator [Micromonospora sp.]
MTGMTNMRIHPDDSRVIPVWDLGDRLTKALRVSRLGVAEVAEYLGVTRSTVSRWMHGQVVPNKATLIVLSDLTGVDYTWLVKGDELRARRDSNPKPSGWESRRPLRSASVKPGLTPNRRRPVCRTIDPKVVP